MNTNMTKEEMNRFAEENINLAYYMVNKLRHTSNDKSELESLVMLGYAKALKGFDPSKNIQFSTYATKCITNEVFSFYKKEKRRINTVSLNGILSQDKNGNSLHLEDLVSSDNNDDEFKSGEEALVMQEEDDNISKMLDELPDLERRVFCMKIGLFNNDKNTIKQIAKKLGLDSKEVNSIYNSALRKIKKIYVKHTAQE